MYIPASFAEPDRVILHNFMSQHSFATLVTNAGGEMIASHLPLLLDSEVGEAGRLVGHMARANSQWRRVDGQALVVFSGPHAYISPSWYETAGTVPTWNYVAVHAYGNLQIIEDRDELLDILRRSVSTYEAPRPEPWRFDASEPHVDNLLKAIVGFRIEITRIEGKWKLGQNHPEERRREVIRALFDAPDDDSRAIAELMSDSMDR